MQLSNAALWKGNSWTGAASGTDRFDIISQSPVPLPARLRTIANERMQLSPRSVANVIAHRPWQWREAGVAARDGPEGDEGGDPARSGHLQRALGRDVRVREGSDPDQAVCVSLFISFSATTRCQTELTFPSLSVAPTMSQPDERERRGPRPGKPSTLPLPHHPPLTPSSYRSSPPRTANPSLTPGER